VNALNVSPASFPTPWAARAFAIVRAISEAKWIDLNAFQHELIDSISSHEQTGACIADEASYYDCWIVALTALIHKKGLANPRLCELEDEIRRSLLAMAHSHDDEHDHAPEPIFTESSL
jgi:nitrile hydratase accessory protein